MALKQVQRFPEWCNRAVRRQQAMTVKPVSRPSRISEGRRKGRHHRVQPSDFFRL